MLRFEDEFAGFDIEVELEDIILEMTTQDVSNFIPSSSREFHD
jgi:hypothetical protein